MQVNRPTVSVPPCTRLGQSVSSRQTNRTRIRSAFVPIFLGQSFFSDLPPVYQIAVHGVNADVRQANSIFDALTQNKSPNPSIKELRLGSTRPFYVTIYPGTHVNNNEELKRFLNDYMTFKQKHYIHGGNNHAYIGMKDGKIHLSTLPPTQVQIAPRSASPAPAPRPTSPAPAPRPTSPAASPRPTSPMPTTYPASASASPPAPAQIISSVKNAWSSFTGLFASKPSLSNDSADTRRWEERLFASEPSPPGQKMQDGDWWSKATGDLAKLVQGGEVKASVINPLMPDGDRHVPTAGTLASPPHARGDIHHPSLKQFQALVNKFQYFESTQIRSFELLLKLADQELSKDKSTFLEAIFTVMSHLDAELNKVIRNHSKDPTIAPLCKEFFKKVESQLVPDYRTNTSWASFKKDHITLLTTSSGGRRRHSHDATMNFKGAPRP